MIEMHHTFPSQPALRKLGFAATGLHEWAAVYTLQNGTEGFLPEDRMQTEVAWARKTYCTDLVALIEKLIEEGLWEKTAGGYLIHEPLIRKVAD
jgi:hypothetical protein